MPRRMKKSKSRRKTGNHRQAPRPTSWNCSRGYCRFCGEPIIEDGKQNNRKHWHQSCADTWRRMNNPSESKKIVFHRERGKCQGENCKYSSLDIKDFDLDHIKPLIESNGDMTYWMLGNLQLLCKRCHKTKTAIDMERLKQARALLQK